MYQVILVCESLGECGECPTRPYLTLLDDQWYQGQVRRSPRSCVSLLEVVDVLGLSC